ncbi:unnamed protein product [marine sediment metagenome]|uniref:Uncharacterized protein n=1 Tax=marine sediment metagenome TaxID=412755 RepID=X1JAP2_9ZZZZ
MLTILKYKRVDIEEPASGKDNLVDMIAGMAGKNRHIVSIACSGANTDFLRLYRDAEQIVDCDCVNLTTTAPWLPMDLPLAEGQQVKVGIYPSTTRTGLTYQITIGYTEAG